MKNYITVKGAKEHNLKNIDIQIPKNKFVVITGLSGSGKSSLAFDTIYAEGQRRYIESLSSYARQFLGRLEKPNVDSIEGLSPAIAIEQKTTNKNPRSTVGTITEIYDYLRLLYARIGEPHCPKCSNKLHAQSLDHIVEDILKLPQSHSNKEIKVQIMSPVARSKKGEFKDVFEKFLKDGFIRVRVNGTIYTLEDTIKLTKNKKHNIDLIIDRLILKKEIIDKQDFITRLTESIELALKVGNNQFFITLNNKEEIFFSISLYCAQCDISFPEINHRLFSFNSPEGACPDCSGIGSTLEFHPDLLIQNSQAPLSEGIISGLGWSANGFWYQNIIQAICSKHNINIDTPWYKLSKKIQELILYGSGKEKLNITWKKEDRSFTSNQTFEGIIPNLHRRYRTTSSEYIKRMMEEYMTFASCLTCKGQRLKPEALSILIKNKNISEISNMSLESIETFFKDITLSNRDQSIVGQVLKEIKNRLSFLNGVGVNYLTLDRIAGSLSGGEAQRIRLATQIGSALTGVLYVLDEPSIGLHQSDNAKLISTLINLRNLGNSVIVVEHDEDTMKLADHIIDVGPGAGLHGGYITFSGSYSDILKEPKSLTGQYLNKSLKIQYTQNRRKGHGSYITINGAQEHNLKSIDVHFPLGTFTCITGLSGSGKSTLINEILFKAIKKELLNSEIITGKFKSIKGIEHINKVIYIDQSPIGKTPRSNSATYTGVFTPIRELFSCLKASKMRGYLPGRFSFNVKGGRCDACQGDGVKRIEMHFLADVFIKCETCKGKRYNRETLEVKYKNCNIYDVLKMRIEEAIIFFEDIPSIYVKLKSLLDVGLGYITLGQSATTLSGGEAQRVKLSTELSKRSTGQTLYILDEPTTGLHFEDVKNLLTILHKFVDDSNTVIIIEHNMDIIKTADWIIDLGPGGGEKGGEIVVTGTPEEIIQNSNSLTGSFLKKWI